MFSALSRGQTGQARRPDSLLLDLSQSNVRTPGAGTGQAKTPTSFRSVPAFAAATSLGEGVEPRFNDPAHSDVKIEVVNSKGELHTLLHLHSAVLREQSDYFFNTLVKRALRESGSTSDPPPTTFTIQTSRSVPDPEIYVTVFRLFYREEEFISEDIVCMGSVWKVLQMLVVSAELQFHACTAACVDYLESVPWNDHELEDIVRLVPQLDRLQDAQPVLERLPVRTWDEETISDALRMLLIRAVSFHDALGGGPITPRGGGFGGSLPSPSSHTTSSSQPDSASAAGEGSGKRGSATESQPKSGKVGGCQPIPGTLECREAACRILRNHQGPLLPLKTKKALLRETFVDLLQCLWTEQRSHAERQGNLQLGGLKPTTGNLVAPEKKPASAASQDADDVSLKPLPIIHDGQGETRKETREPDKGASQKEPALRPNLVIDASSAPLPLLESVYGKFGALTWLTGVMVEFSMADEVFKWLASDKDFLSQTLSLYRSAVHSPIHTDGQPPGTGTSAGSSRKEALLSSLSIVRSALLTLAAAILAKRLVVNTQLRSSFIRTWVPVLAEICSTSQDKEALVYGLPVTDEEKATILTGYNELVLTLPASDQRSIFQLWYLKLSLAVPSAPPTLGPLVPSGRSVPLQPAASAASPPFLSSEQADIPRKGVPEAGSWFSLGPAYKRWLMRLGAPCGVLGADS